MPKHVSTPSRLLQALFQTKDEPALVSTVEPSVPLEMDDLMALRNDIRGLTMEERGMELRDAARYNDYMVIHSLVYVTAVLAGLNSDDSVSKPIPFLDETIDSLFESPVAIARAATDVLQLLRSADETTGNTALHMAAANNHFVIVQLLLQIEQACLDDVDLQNAEDSTQEKRPNTRLVQCVNLSGGNTPLHYAITNRALESLQALLALHEPRVDGTKPIDASDTSTRLYTNPSVDVLQKNSAGRSCLTEAFALSSSSGDTPAGDIDQRNHAILTLVLEHPSANEDRLLDVASSSNGNTKSNATTSTDDNQASPMNSPQHHTHQFRFVGSNSIDAVGVDLSIREMAMASLEPPSSNDDQIAILGGSEPIKDTTGYGIWSVSIIMAQWMTNVFHWNRNTHVNESVIKNMDTAETGNNGICNNVRTVVELGAGCGVPGLTIAKAISMVATKNLDDFAPTKVFLTDLNPNTILNLQHNIELNKLNHVASAVTMDWDDLKDGSKIWPWNETALNEGTFGIDVLIGSDLVYQREAVPALIQTILRLRPQRFYYGAGKNRDGHDLFIDSMSNSNEFELISSRTAPKVFRSNNPLLSQDDDECFIHFQDLLFMHSADAVESDDAFTLYEFVWNASC